MRFIVADLCIPFYNKNKKTKEAKMESDYIQLKDGVKLYYQIHEVDSPYWLIAVHGIGEHLGRHEYLTSVLGSRFNICRFDLRGHGKSEGERSYVESFEQFYSDLAEVLTFLRNKFKMQEYTLFGHSMGALIVAGYLQQLNKRDRHLKFVYLSSPPVGIGGALGEVVRFIPGELFGRLAALRKGVAIPGIVNPKELSSDPQVAKEYIADPYAQKSLNSKLLLELVATAKKVFAKPLRIWSPVVCSVGAKDKIVSVTELVNYFTLIDKSVKLRIFKDAKHEIHNEVKSIREEYFDFLESSFLQALSVD